MAIVLIAGLLVVLRPWTNWNKSKDDLNTDNDASFINLDPPTKEEIQQSEENKSDVSDRENIDNNPANPGSVKSVTPIITSWSQDQTGKFVTVSAFIQSIYEDGGKCTLTVTKDQKTVTKNEVAYKNVTSTSCPTFTVFRDELGPGRWRFEVTYLSDTAKGASLTQELQVN